MGASGIPAGQAVQFASQLMNVLENTAAMGLPEAANQLQANIVSGAARVSDLIAAGEGAALQPALNAMNQLGPITGMAAGAPGNTALDAFQGFTGQLSSLNNVAGGIPAVGKEINDGLKTVIDGLHTSVTDAVKGVSKIADDVSKDSKEIVKQGTKVTGDLVKTGTKTGSHLLSGAGKAALKGLGALNPFAHHHGGKKSSKVKTKHVTKTHHVTVTKTDMKTNTKTREVTASKTATKTQEVTVTRTDTERHEVTDTKTVQVTDHETVTDHATVTKTVETTKTKTDHTTEHVTKVHDVTKTKTEKAKVTNFITKTKQVTEKVKVTSTKTKEKKVKVTSTETKQKEVQVTAVPTNMPVPQSLPSNLKGFHDPSGQIVAVCRPDGKHVKCYGASDKSLIQYHESKSKKDKKFEECAARTAKCFEPSFPDLPLTFFSDNKKKIRGTSCAPPANVGDAIHCWGTPKKSNIKYKELKGDQFQKCMVNEKECK